MKNRKKERKKEEENKAKIRTNEKTNETITITTPTEHYHPLNILRVKWNPCETSNGQFTHFIVNQMEKIDIIRFKKKKKKKKKKKEQVRMAAT